MLKLLLSKYAFRASSPRKAITLCCIVSESSVSCPQARPMTQRKRTYVKDVEFKMRTMITAEIFPNEVISFSEKCPGCEDGETAKLSDGTFLNFGDKATIKK